MNVIDINIYKEKEIVIKNMQKFGGNFIKKLSEALRVADINNTQIIKKSFPEYWKQYLEW